jgi:hypothetical protein
LADANPGFCVLIGDIFKEEVKEPVAKQIAVK